MSKKYFLYLLIGLIYLSIEEPEILPLSSYYEKTVYRQTYFYLYVGDIDKGYEVDFQLKFEDKHNYYPYYSSSVNLDYKQSNYFTKFNFDYDFEELRSYNYYRYGSNYTFYFTIKLNEKTNYLLLKPYVRFYNELTIINTAINLNFRSNFLTIKGIVVIIVILIIIAILIAIIYLYRRRKNKFLPTKIFPQQNFPAPILPPQNYPITTYPQQNYPTTIYPQQNYPTNDYPQEFELSSINN